MLVGQRLRLGVAVKDNIDRVLPDIDCRHVSEQSVEEPGPVVVASEDGRLVDGEASTEEGLQFVIAVLDITLMETFIDALDAGGAGDGRCDDKNVVRFAETADRASSAEASWERSASTNEMPGAGPANVENWGDEPDLTAAAAAGMPSGRRVCGRA